MVLFSNSRRFIHLFNDVQTRDLLALPLILSVTLSGCRIGNHIDQAVKPTDKYTGYYLTELKDLTFSGTTSQTVTKTAPLTSVLSDISIVFTNPVALALLDSYTGKATFQSVNGKHSLPVTIL